MNPGLVFLRIKIKSLAAESRIIQHEERRADDGLSAYQEERALLKRSRAKMTFSRLIDISTSGNPLTTNPYVNLTDEEYKELLLKFTAIIAKKKQGDPDRLLFSALRQHRIQVVREEARYSLIAYAFLRDKAYFSIEPDSKSKVDWKRVWNIAKRFGATSNDEERFKEWQKIPAPAYA